MSWQVVSFLIVGAVLIAGFAWYERSRPPAQVIALVAALAALAIVGRIAFAAFPNVKPTTDIVIFAGYALGAAPGFAVGALAALVSNFWFGQGPWTPWQMMAWGLCGILGAALARAIRGLRRREVGRLTLAAVCGLAALGYGAILNFSLMASYGGELSWQRFVGYESTAVPFEIAHFSGNVAFALLAGPAMVRMLIRFRERFEWKRTEAARIGPPTTRPPRTALPTGGIAALLAAVLLLGAFASARAEAATEPGPGAALAWLEAAQNEDGGYGESRGADSSQQMTGWAMLGLEAAGVNPQEVAKSGTSAVAYLQKQVAAVHSPGDLARTILALEGAGIEPREFGGRNLVAALLAKRRKDGSYEDWPGSTAYAVLALRAAGIANVADSLEWLREAQNEDGGWGDVVGSPSTADGTGAVLQALSPSSKAAQKGVGYLRQVQQPGGGFRLGGNGALNTQSTAWAIEGLLATGANPAQFKKGGKSAYEYLEDNQAGDGHYRYSSKSDQTPVWVTAEVLVAASKQYLPLAAVPVAPAPAPTPTPAPTPAPEPLPLPLPEEAGGVTPLPSATPEFPESAPSGQSHHGSKGGKGKGGKGTPGGVGTGEGISPATPVEGGAIPEGTSPIEPEGSENGEGFITGTPVDESDDSGSGGSVLGSIVAGLVAGAILFALGYGPYRRWQATHGGHGGKGGPPATTPGGGATPPPSAGVAPGTTPAAAAPVGAGGPAPSAAAPMHTPPPINAPPPSGPPAGARPASRGLRRLF